LACHEAYATLKVESSCRVGPPHSGAFRPGEG
jgi:hypothetical protein